MLIHLRTIQFLKYWRISYVATLPHYRATKKSDARPTIIPRDFVRFILILLNAVAVAIPKDNNLRDSAIASNMPVVMPAENPTPSNKPSMTISTPMAIKKTYWQTFFG